MHFTKKENRCGNCGNYSVKLDKEKNRTENMSKETFSFATSKTK